MAHKFGWCMDGHCSGCPFHYRDWYQPEVIIECSCECHQGKKKPPLPKMHTPPKEEKRQRKARKQSR